jgi:hypothetical protein
MRLERKTFVAPTVILAPWEAEIKKIEMDANLGK